MTFYTSPTLLTGKVPGQITSSGKIAGLGKSGTVWYGPLAGEADFTYSDVKPGTVAPTPPPPVVTPPPPPPPPVVTPPAPAAPFHILKVGNDRYSWNSDITLAWNDGACLGAMVSITKDANPLFAGGKAIRAAFFDHAKQFDVVGHGRWIEGFSAGADVGGKRVTAANLPLSGYHLIKGAFGDGLNWKGATAFGLAVEQDPVLTKRETRVKVTLTNTTDKPMHNVRYMRSVDFDMDDDSVPNRDVDAFPTNNSIPAVGTALCGFRGVGKGLYGYLTTEDTRAKASIFGFANVDPYAAAAYDAAKPVNPTAKAGDLTANLCWHVGTLLPGESTTLVYRLGITDDPKAIGF